MALHWKGEEIMRRQVVGTILLTLLAVAFQPAAADVLPAKYRLEPFAAGIDRPEGMALAPDGRIFVLERVTGNVRVVREGVLMATPFVTVPVAANAGTSEAGLLGIALHPDFIGNGWVYLYYTHDLGGSSTNRIVRYTALGDLGVDPLIILDNIGAGPNGNDNGGGLAFGNDGKLYATVGVMEDDSNASSFTSLGGKVLRMNPEDGSAPPDNPNTELSWPYDLIWAIGLRNSAGMAFNKDVGTLYVTDSYATEASVDCDEVNVAMEGVDYGWQPLACGTSGYPPAPMQTISPEIGASGVVSDTGDRYAGACSNDPTRTCSAGNDCKLCSNIEKACDEDADCMSCVADPGQACTSDLECSTCQFFTSVHCTSNDDCRSCDISPYNRMCDSQADCMRCTKSPFNWCRTDAECGGGGSRCSDDVIPCGSQWQCQLDTCGGACANDCNDPANNLFVAGASNGSTSIVRDLLTGVDYDESASSSDFYVPTGTCPTAVTDLSQGKDGWIYATAAGTSPGLYRLIYDDYGIAEAAPREVGASQFAPLTLGKQGSGVELLWEDLKKDAWGCSDRSYCSGDVLKFCDDDGDCAGTCVPRSCPTGSETTKYTLWSGPLVAPFSYGHTVLAELDGIDAGDALVSHVEASMPSGDTYYLVSARGANLEGTTGYDSAAVERPGHATADLCDDIGYGDQFSDYEVCVGDGPRSYPDQNNRLWTMNDFRGRAVLMSLMQYG
jgi:hypothetical protein